MKSSRFNHFFSILNGEVILAYNSLSGAVAEIERDQYPAIQQILANPNNNNHSATNELSQGLAGAGFLVPDGVDELSVLKVKDRSNRLDGTVLTLTIAPTLACNFSCDYCYESRSATRMTDETQDALVRFADSWLNRAEGLRICWFGGEPTLCMSIIEGLQRRLQGLTEKFRVTMHPGVIITNGYLLNAEMATRLRDLGILHAQITLDGLQDVHDRRRKLHSGKGTFQRIVNNLSVAAEILKLSVRVNIDKQNVESAYDVVVLLKERGILDKVKISFAPLVAAGSICSDVREQCHDNEEFSRVLVTIYTRLYENGLHNVNYPRVNLGTGCGATADGYFVVSPTGHLFKCWEDLSMDADKSIGSITTSDITSQQLKNRLRYDNWGPFDKTGCLSCSILPICMGGCPARAHDLQNQSCGDCTTWKYNLKEMMELSYQVAGKQQK